MEHFIEQVINNKTAIDTHQKTNVRKMFLCKLDSYI